MSIIPVSFSYVKTFTSREIYSREAGKWQRQLSEETEPLDVQINRWVVEEKVQLTAVPSPNVQVLSDEPDRREYLFVIAVRYVPPTEGERDVVERTNDTDNTT